jgi:DeoR/GlpR family transcriptional regulator of sugar metabolism
MSASIASNMSAIWWAMASNAARARYRGTRHMPGGQFKAPTLSLSGDTSVEYFRNIFAAKLFLATAGVALDAGLTYPSFADLQLKAAMIKAGSRVYLVAESTKINKSSFTRLGSLEMIHAFVTDSGISESDANVFRARGIEMLIA